jgi:hypothetical protein
VVTTRRRRTDQAWSRALTPPGKKEPRHASAVSARRDCVRAPGGGTLTNSEAKEPGAQPTQVTTRQVSDEPGEVVVAERPASGPYLVAHCSRRSDAEGRPTSSRRGQAFGQDLLCCTVFRGVAIKLFTL